MITQEGADGIDETSWTRLRRGRIAYIPQDPNIALNPVMRIGRQIAEGIRYAEPQVEKLDREKRAIELLEKVGIEDAQRVHDAHPHQLSGGQRQRVLIAIALIGSFTLQSLFELPRVPPFSMPIAETYGEQFAKIRRALSEHSTAHQLPPSPALASTLSEIEGSDVMVVFVESYGRVAYDRRDFVDALPLEVAP